MNESSPKTGGGTTTDPGSVSETLSLDVAFDVLADRRRRHLLDCLRESESPVALGELARDVAARERGPSDADAPPEAVDRVHLTLYHSHVPKLAAADVVEYDRERDLVAPSRGSDRVERVLDLAAANE